MTKGGPPKIDIRKFSDQLKMLKKLVPHYTPEWAASDEKDPGVALLKIFCHVTENVVNRFNQVPHKNFVAFLDMLGIKLLPAQPSRVPLTFKLAEGTEKEILIPARTQAAADKTEEHKELPFETEKNLLATPSQLKKVISIDPKKDAIYLPPPDFLNGESQGKSEVAYTIVSSPSAGAKNFQLDHVTNLEEGDFLKIVNGDNVEYVIISSISGTVVSATDRLLHSYPANTPVEKLIAFTLFEGKNMQEHSLYIGHKDLFNVKSTAQFILSITHYGVGAGVTPLKASWEYWGEINGQEGKDWQKFQVIDKTRGLSLGGDIELNKMAEGKIKEKEINGTKSRWIRCKLEEPLNVDVLRKLPVLDNIVFRVKSAGRNLSPDQAFNNDIPLDITKPFAPFGKEPRMFANFSIANKEVFSKKGAKVTLDFDVEPRGILGAPTAIEYDGKIRVFARGTYGRLMEVQIDPTGQGEPVWPPDHGFPPETKIAPESTPCAIKYPLTVATGQAQNISVFARAENGHLIERFCNGVQWQWIDHGPPKNGISLKFDPAAIYSEEKSVISVFVTGSDGNLYEFGRNPDRMTGIWIEHGNPDITTIASSPYAVSSERYKLKKIFVKGQNGQLYEWELKSDGTPSKRWKTDYGSPALVKPDVKVDSRPFASEIYEHWGYPPQYHTKVFMKGSDGNLWEYDTLNQSWIDLGLPDGGTVDSAPHGYISNPESTDIAKENKHIFIRSAANRLWVINDLGWTSHQTPANLKLTFSPFVLHRKQQISEISAIDYLHIFSASSHNSIIERKLIFSVIQGLAQDGYAGPPSTITLSDDASQNDDAYNGMQIEINGGTGIGQIRTITNYNGMNSIATVDSDWDTVPDNTSRYRVIGYGLKIWNEYKDPNETALTPTLSWEYWNKKGWMVLKGIKDETANLLKSGKITFVLPEDIDETEIAGQKNYWIRVRIIGGDYGKETFALSLSKPDESPPLYALAATLGSISAQQQLISTKSTIRPPIVNSLTISYAVETRQFPQQCHTYNNLDYLDQSEACKSEDKHFSPFVQLEDKDRTLYLGFEKSFKGGPIKIFFGAKELSFTEEKKPKLEWSYSAKNKWGKLSYLDATEGLIKADILELIGPSDFSAHSRFGNYLYWIKGSLTKGEYEEPPLLDGIYANTTWSFQAETIKDEILGSSDGEPDQTFSFLKFPVLEGEEIRVRETLSEEEKQALIGLLGEGAVYEIKDEKGNVTETWVLCSEVSDFFDSTAESRHYTLDRATGELQFGDGINGMIPPAGDDNIKAFSYQAGGGGQGNVKAGEIKTLKSAVAGVDKVSNPVDADGGADTATLDQMLEIGPAMISHRNRAVTVEDFEWLAKQASRKVVKVRCLPNSNNKKVTEIGWVTVIIVPDSLEEKPFPSLELRRKVRKHLEDHCANTLSSMKHVYIAGPFYKEIGVSVDVYVTSIDVASEVEREVRKKLKAFFHPLTGGAEGKGWDFGRDVSASDIYALLEGIKGIDHVENVKFIYNGKTGEDIVEIEQNFLVANGKHSINLQHINGE
ncbi:MAG: putative baseplate assembly protein [Deltaproteobacteria bacterium]|jgi:uncharacterized phage protein gp47/JayE|nr:putative baseplate assembly protein [Deltaproteobacteria bacterium]